MDEPGAGRDQDAVAAWVDSDPGRVLLEYLETWPGHADLGDWGVEGDRGWVQYMLSADDERFPDESPMAVTRTHPKPDRLREEEPADQPRIRATDPTRTR